MTTPIGYAPVQLIPVLGKGFSAEVDKQLGGVPGLGKSAGKKLGDGFSAGVGDGMKAAEKAVEQSTRKIEQLKDKVANSTDAARLAEEKYQEAVEKGATGSRLTSAVNAREKALRQQTSLTRDLTRETERLERAQRDLADGAGVEQGGASAGASFLDGFTGGVAALGTKAGPIGAGIMAAGAVALAGGAFIGSQVMAGMQREVASDRIAAQLGLNDAEMARFGNIAGRTYAANFGESMGDVGDALAAVTSTLGKDSSADAIESMTQKALTFRDVFGTDVAESVAFAQNLIVNGLAPNAESAFDMMVTAYQRVPAAMRDELPEILSEYSTYFQSLGFSGEEAFGLLVNTAPKGQIALDKLGDSLKEFTLLATDLGSKPVQEALFNMGFQGADVANNLLAGGATAQQQFDDIVDALLRIPDAGEQAAAAVALFGTPLEDLDKAKIPEFLRSLDDGERAMDGFAGSAQNMVETAGDNAAGSWESAMRTIELANADVQNSLAEAFGPALEEAAEWVTTHGPEIEGFFTGLGKVAIISLGSVTAFTAELIGGLALIVNAVGDTYGAIATVQAELADLMGDDEKAASFREQAAAGFGLADSLYEMRDGAATARDGLRDILDSFGDTADSADAADDKVGRLEAGFGHVGTSAGGAADDVKRFNEEMAKTPAGMPWLTGTPVPGQGGTPGYNPLNPSGVYGNVPAPGGSGFVIPPMFAGGGGGNSFGAGSLGDVPLHLGQHTEDTGGAIVPNNAALQQALQQAFPGAGINNDYRQPDGFNEHSSGEAVDIEVNPGGAMGVKTDAGQAQGDAINQWLLQNAEKFGLQYTIWQGQNWNPDGSTSPNSGSGITGGHWDHVHARVSPGSPLSNAYRGSKARSADWDAMADKEASGDWNANTGNGFYGGLQFAQSTWEQYGGKEFAARADLASPDQQKVVAERTLNGWNSIPGQGPSAWPNTFTPGTPGADGTVQGPIDPSVINAFGAGYDPGIGTPGYDEYGKPGYFEVDPKKVREAQQRVEDQAERIREADEAARQAQVAIDELKADADQSERDAAVERKRKADYDAQVARRELDDLKAEYDEAQTGTFSPAKEAREKSDDRGVGGSKLSLSSSFSGLGSALGEFAGGQIGSALDVFGVPDSPGWLQAASKFIGGISIGGMSLGGGPSAEPLSAAPTLTGTSPPPGSAGIGGGDRVRTGPTYHLHSRDAEDALVKVKRVERERTAAKLDRY